LKTAAAVQQTPVEQTFRSRNSSSSLPVSGCTCLHLHALAEEQTGDELCNSR